MIAMGEGGGGGFGGWRGLSRGHFLKERLSFEENEK